MPRGAFWLVDTEGLLTDDMGQRLRDYQSPYARSSGEVKRWKRIGPQGVIDLAEVVRQVRPTMLIGTSTAAGTFTEAIVREMSKHCDRPIVFPLSNPAPLAEATPADLIAWTEGRALIATGSPFQPGDLPGSHVCHRPGEQRHAVSRPVSGRDRFSGPLHQ